MSYYHFFTLKKDSKFNEMTVEDIKSKMKRNTSSFNRNYKGLLKANMVRWYYDAEGDLNDRAFKISSFIWGIYYDITDNRNYELAIEAKEDEDGIVRNRPMPEYEMQELVENWQNTINSVVEDLLILSCVRFEADTEHSDVAKTTPDYLKYDYQNEIDEKLNYFIDECYDYSFAKFCLEECDRMTEDEKYNLEYENDGVSSTSGDDL